MLPYARIEHGEFFRNRASERELCQDFPGDKILIDGLHSMQVHLWSNGLNIEIPVVKVMNAAHYLAAYMFRTTCSGDQTEYDTLAYCSVGHDKRLMLISIIVLAAMLQRTEGLRAGQCRDILIENRNEDFEEGVTLYERFLRSAEKRFAEEDFLLDTHTAISRLQTENKQLITENEQLKKTIHTMSKEKTIIHVAGNYIAEQNIDIHDNQNVYLGGAPSGACEQSAEKGQREPGEHSSLFTKKAHTEGRETEIIQSLQQSLVGRQDKARALVEEVRHWQREGYIDPHYNARVMYDELNKIINLPFQYGGFRKYYNE